MSGGEKFMIAFFASFSAGVVVLTASIWFGTLMSHG